MALDAKFFKRAKKANRAVEITDLEAVIPATKDLPQVRVPLPNRRELTMEERAEILAKRKGELVALEEEIEVERKKLLALVQSYQGGSGSAAEVVAQNLKIRDLMERRRTMVYPEIWIKTLTGINRTDIFESKRDIRKVEGGGVVFQVAHRIEPITSLYTDLGAVAGAALREAEEADAQAAATVVAEKAAKKAATIAAAIPKTAAESAQGAIIGARKVIKLKKPGGGGGTGGPGP